MQVYHFSREFPNWENRGRGGCKNFLSAEQKMVDLRDETAILRG